MSNPTLPMAVKGLTASHVRESLRLLDYRNGQEIGMREIGAAVVDENGRKLWTTYNSMSVAVYRMVKIGMFLPVAGTSKRSRRYTIACL